MSPTRSCPFRRCQGDQRAVRECVRPHGVRASHCAAIAEGEIDVAPLITGEVGLDRVGAAFDELVHARRALQDPRDALAASWFFAVCRASQRTGGIE